MPHARAPPQSREVIIREAEFKKVRELFLRKMLSLKDYVIQVRNIYTFEPKKKYLEYVEDTDVSDEEPEPNVDTEDEK